MKSLTIGIFMQKSLFLFAIVVGLGVVMWAFPSLANNALLPPFQLEDTKDAALPRVPNTALPIAERDATAVPTLPDISTLQKAQPLRLRIPSIRLNAPVQDVGLTETGAMDVPSGKTNNVGWYGAGTVPGEIGSAVMDAHVYAAFKNLKYAKVGSDVYVDMSDGTTLHFVIAHSMLYKLEDVPLNWLFGWNDDEHLNLITCAGKFIRSQNTYDHRLIVYTKLVD